MFRKWSDQLRRLLGFSSDRADDFLQNEAVRNKMRKEGDNCRTPRPIDHYAYFPTSEARARYREFIVSRGYRIEREDVSAADDSKLVIIFSKVDAPVAIDRETFLLENQAMQMGGYYDGWVTDVIRQS